ncbi:MAG: ABC transporter permease [Planctomycetaceae bacterium]|nr:MAG: ABC transporter permease [Planctomycetaceae bacterium]
MFKFLARRFISVILVLWVIATVTFIFMHLIPGGPFTREKKLPAAIMKNIEERYHLNDPLPKQYLDYFNDLLHGDLGPSFAYQGRTVNEIIAEGFPISATLGLVAVGIALFIGIPAGVISSLYRNRWQDNLAMLSATIFVSVPNFILASLLMLVFALKLRWFPAAMWGEPSQVVLPAIALTGFPTAFISRLTRSSMVEVMEQDYIRTARAKGLSMFKVVVRHAVKNSIIPVVTYIGPMMALIMTGTFVVENIFAIPGLGRYFVTSIYNRDYTVILGVTLFYSAVLVFFNFMVDLAYAVIDPRIRLADAGKE